MGINVIVNGDRRFMTAEEIANLDEKFQIKIKKKNQGKFAAEAKAAGMSTEEYAKKVLADPTATAKQKSRANFANNAITKFQH